MALKVPLPVEVLEEEEVDYPESDGKPMAETDVHIEQIIYLRTALQHHFRHRPDVYVSGNILVYYSQGDPSAVVSPDILVVKGVEKKRRRTYKTWKEGGKAPDVVMEVTARKTQFEDTFTKFNIYEQVLQAREYFQHDPTGDYLQPRLQGYRLVGGKYEPIEGAEEGRLHSQELGLDLVDEEGFLRLYNPTTGERLRTPEEEAEARQRAEEEAARLRAELEALRQQRG